MAILLYADFEDYINFLSLEEKGSLLEAIFKYAFSSSEPEGLSEKTAIVFTVIRNQIDRDTDKYKKKCEANRKNGALGGRPRKNMQLKEDDSGENEEKGENEKKSAAEEKCTVDEAKAKAQDREREKKFSDFFDFYPVKAGREAAFREFSRLSPDPVLYSKIMTALALQKNSPQWQKEGGRFVPLPARWLCERRWEDDVSALDRAGGEKSEKEVKKGSFDEDDFFAASLGQLDQLEKEMGYT